MNDRSYLFYGLAAGIVFGFAFGYFFWLLVLNHRNRKSLGEPVAVRNTDKTPVTNADVMRGVGEMRSTVAALSLAHAPSYTWRCENPHCGTRLYESKESFVNENRANEKCPDCGTRSSSKSSDRIRSRTRNRQEANGVPVRLPLNDKINVYAWVCPNCGEDQHLSVVGQNPFLDHMAVCTACATTTKVRIPKRVYGPGVNERSVLAEEVGTKEYRWGCSFCGHNNTLKITGMPFEWRNRLCARCENVTKVCLPKPSRLPQVTADLVSKTNDLVTRKYRWYCSACLHHNDFIVVGDTFDRRRENCFHCKRDSEVVLLKTSTPQPGSPNAFRSAMGLSELPDRERWTKAEQSLFFNTSSPSLGNYTWRCGWCLLVWSEKFTKPTGTGFVERRMCRSCQSTTNVEIPFSPGGMI